MKVLFLDIDGVLNRLGMVYPSVVSKPIDSDLASRLNRILLLTDARVVISSTWRHLIHNGHYDLYGFAHMLKTHGIHADVIGITGPSNGEGRGKQIRNWLRENLTIKDYVVLDDDDTEMSWHGERYIRVNSTTGLTDANVAEAIKILGPSTVGVEITD